MRGDRPVGKTKSWAGPERDPPSDHLHHCIRSLFPGLEQLKEIFPGSLRTGEHLL